MIITGKKFSKPKLSRVINGDDAPATGTMPTASARSTAGTTSTAGATSIAGATSTTPASKTRLDHLLVAKYPEYNRSILQKFIKAGLVKVNGKVVKKPNTLLSSDAKIELTPPTAARTFPQPPVLFENSQVLLLDKPAGMLSMAKGAFCPETTLEDFGLLVHRLDRDTSGVVILAKDPATQSFLRRQFQERKTHKTYFAVVHGRPKQDKALIDLPISRNFKRPNTFLVDAGGKPSQTYYETVATNGKYSLLMLKPRTGRTHQLRVHLNYLGTPIVGDPVYGTPADIAAAAQVAGQAKGGTAQATAQAKADTAQAAAQAKATSVQADTLSAQADAPRMFLHAAALEITLPNPTGDNQRCTFQAPPPTAFTDFFKKSGEWLVDPASLAPITNVNLTAAESTNFATAGNVDSVQAKATDQPATPQTGEH